ARLHGLPTAELLSKARVICETRQEGKNVRTFFCNDGQTCVNAAGTWKCRSPAPAGMSCATCLANQKRDCGLVHQVRRSDAAERLRQSRQRRISQMYSRLPLG